METLKFINEFKNIDGNMVGSFNAMISLNPRRIEALDYMKEVLTIAEKHKADVGCIDSDGFGARYNVTYSFTFYSKEGVKNKEPEGDFEDIDNYCSPKEFNEQIEQFIEEMDACYLRIRAKYKESD